MLSCSHEKRFDRPQRPFVWLARLVKELVPPSPPTRADHVQSSRRNLPEILVPDVRIGMLEIETLHLARHVRRSDHCQRLPIELKKVSIDGDLRTRLQVL